MTIREAINLLIELEEKHGASTKLYFDCPNCDLSFTPDNVVAKAIIMKSLKK